MNKNSSYIDSALIFLLDKHFQYSTTTTELSHYKDKNKNVLLFNICGLSTVQIQLQEYSYIRKSFHFKNGNFNLQNPS